MSSMRPAVRLTLFGLVLAVVACVTTNATVLSQSRLRPAILPDSVSIYLTRAEVHERYDEIALLNSKGDSHMTNEQQMYNSMRKKAAELGANGIILDATTEPGTGARVARALLGTSADRKGRAIAIYVHRGDSTAAVVHDTTH